MKKRGYALPLSLCVAGVTLMLGLSAAQMTNGDLGLANHQYYQERARQMADFGLEYCVSHAVKPGSAIPLNSLSAAHPFDAVSVRMYSFGEPGSPMVVPKGFEYWVAEGRASESPSANPLASARVGALVRYGLPSGSSGAQVRSLFINSDDPVQFTSVDGLTNQSVTGESVISSDYDGGASPPLPFPGQNNVIDLNKVDLFLGNFRIPKGVSQSVVHFNSPVPVQVSTDGGPMNVPTFSPPSGMPYMASRILDDSFNGNLPSGRYGLLEVSPNANVHLDGTYHFEQLKLSDNTPLDKGGTFRVDSNDSAKVFVSKINLGQGTLNLTNDHGSAQNFRFTVQASAPNPLAPDPVLNFKLTNGGGVALVADGYRVRLAADQSREIRGAFTARALEANFKSSTLSLIQKPFFIYDVSATTARRSGVKGKQVSGGTEGYVGDDGSANTSSAGNSGNSGSTSDTGGNTRSNPSGDGDGGQDESGNAGDLTTQGSANPKGNAGLEPMILSRQPL